MSKIVKFCTENKIPVAVRGGGHGYTCQASTAGGLIIDMRSMRSMRIMTPTAPSVSYAMEVGTGLVWKQVLNKLKDLSPAVVGEGHKLYTVHGQCTSVGIGGFSLHGGVHLGFSEFFGLASDNIIAATVVVASGDIINITESSCTVINGVKPVDVDEQSCRDLWFGLRGAGSSFGVVTSLTLRLHKLPVHAIQSVLSILTIDTSHPQAASLFIEEYLSRFDRDRVSLTLFGLDAYFKAYFFLLKFAKDKVEAVRYSPRSLFGAGVGGVGVGVGGGGGGEGGGEGGEAAMPSKRNQTLIHFVVEAAWLEGHEQYEALPASHDRTSSSDSSSGSSNGSSNGSSSSSDSSGTDMFARLASIHSTLHHPNPPLNSTDSTHTQTLHEPPIPFFIARPWIRSPDLWSVSSYDIAWGTGHLYGGAHISTVTGDVDGQRGVLEVRAFCLSLYHSLTL